MLIISIKCSNIKIAQRDQAYELERIYQDGFSLKGFSLTGFKDSFFSAFKNWKSHVLGCTLASH